MRFIYLQHSGKPVQDSGGNFWTMAGVSIDADQWKTLQLRVNGLEKSFLKKNYAPGTTSLDANKLLHPRHAEKSWTLAFCKGLEKIVAGLDVRFFIVVVDKRTTDKPAHPRWLLPLSYHYLVKPITQSLREKNEFGTLVIPPGRPEEKKVIESVQTEQLFGPAGRSSPLIASPMIQDAAGSCGIQVADFVACVARRYHETVYPKLFAKQILHGYDAVINSHYQGFVKPATYQSDAQDAKGYRIRGYIYLWRREAHGLRLGRMSEDEVPLPGESGEELRRVHAGSDRGSSSGEAVRLPDS